MSIIKINDHENLNTESYVDEWRRLHAEKTGTPVSDAADILPAPVDPEKAEEKDADAKSKNAQKAQPKKK